MRGAATLLRGTREKPLRCKAFRSRDVPQQTLCANAPIRFAQPAGPCCQGRNPCRLAGNSASLRSRARAARASARRRRRGLALRTTSDELALRTTSDERRRERQRIQVFRAWVGHFVGLACGLLLSHRAAARCSWVDCGMWRCRAGTCSALTAFGQSNAYIGDAPGCCFGFDPGASVASLLALDRCIAVLGGRSRVVQAG